MGDLNQILLLIGAVFVCFSLAIEFTKRVQSKRDDWQNDHNSGTE